MLRSVNALLDALIDYAGLFPPAGLSMREAVANYARYRQGPRSFALARFVAPAGRLTELELEWTRSGMPPNDPLRVSALVADPAHDLPLVNAFNERRGGIVDAIEVKASSQAEIETIRAAVPASLTTYYELPLAHDLGTLIRDVRDAGGRAKVRTGGVTPEAFPSSRDIVRFMHECIATGTPFKATAGLHHPLRCVRPLTYEPGSVTGMMHGFANVFLAATLLRERAEQSTCIALLDDDDPANFTAEDDAITWRDVTIGSESIAQTRRDVAISFGSCSFEEPIADLEAIGWLTRT